MGLDGMSLEPSSCPVMTQKLQEREGGRPPLCSASCTSPHPPQNKSFDYLKGQACSLG